MASDKSHDVLESWQLAVGIATGLVGLIAYRAQKAKATPEQAPVTTTPASPTGYGEVGGGGGGGSSPGSSLSSPTLTGQQTTSSGTGSSSRAAELAGLEASRGSLPKSPSTPAGEPAPGESLAEYERSHWAKPGGRQLRQLSP